MKQDDTLLAFWRGNPTYGDDTLLTSLKNTIPTLHAEAFTMKGEDDTLLAFLARQSHLRR